MSSLSEILEGESAPVSAEAPAPVEAPEPAETKTGEDTAPPAEVKADNTDKPVEDKPEDRVPVAALKEERQKRQELERLLAEAKGRASAYSEIHSAKPKGKEDDSSPEDEFYSNPIEFIKKETQSVQQLVQQQRIDISEEFVRSQYDDAEDALGAFGELAKSNPHLISQMVSHRNPGKFAYDAGKMYLETKDVGSISGLREKLEKEIRAKVEAELRAEQAKSAAGQVTPNNARARAAGPGTSQAAPQGHIPLAELFGR